MFDQKHTQETRRKISESKKGKNNPMYGVEPWNKGKHHSKETRRKISESKKGKKSSQETIAKMRTIFKGPGNPMYGKHHTKSVRLTMNVKKKVQFSGNNNPFYGKTHSYNTLCKIVEFRIGGFWYGNVRNDYSLVSMIRSLPEYKKWTQDVLNRDEYKDTNTKKICLYPNVHHIIEVNILIHKYKIKTIDDARKCKVLWDINNGITMERENHIKLHGYSYNAAGKRIKQIYNIDEV